MQGLSMIDKYLFLIIQGMLKHYKEDLKSWKLTRYFQQPSVSITVFLETRFKLLSMDSFVAW